MAIFKCCEWRNELILHGALWASLEGESQTVPLSELMGVLHVMRACENAKDDVTIWVDCLYVVNTYDKGVTFAAETHAAQWQEFWRLHKTMTGKVYVNKIWRSHVDAENIACGQISPYHAAANTCVDELAKCGAKLNEVPDIQAEHIGKIRCKAWRVQQRFVEAYLQHIITRRAKLDIKKNLADEAKRKINSKLNGELIIEDESPQLLRYA